MPATAATGDLVAQVAERAGGNPLFAEEMVNRLHEEGDRRRRGAARNRPLGARRAARLARSPRAAAAAVRSVVGQNFWEGALQRAAEPRRTSTSAALSRLQEKELLVIGGRTSRLAGEREYAFKHALIRDVAYGDAAEGESAAGSTTPSARFIESAPASAARAPWPGRRALRPGRDAGRRVGIDADELRRTREPGAASSPRPRATRRRPSTPTGGARPLHGRARVSRRWIRRTRSRAIGEKIGDVALRLGRVEKAIAVWQECLDYHRREEDLARVGDLHRKIGAGPLGQGGARGLDRPLPERHRPAQGRAPVHRAGAALRGGRLALHAHRRQHARDLRLREGAAAGRAARRGRRREPGPRDLRPGLRPHRRLREGAREPRALGRAGPRLRHVEAVRALLTLGYHFEVSEAAYGGAAEAYRRRWGWRSRSATSPPRSRSTRRSPSCAVPGRLGGGRARDRGQRRPRRARGPARQALLPLRDAGRPALASRRLGGGGQVLPAGARARRAGRPLRGRLPALFWLAATLRDSGDRRRRDGAGAGPRRLRARRPRRPVGRGDPARAVCLALAGRTDQARDAAEEAERLAERLHYPVGEAATARPAARAPRMPRKRPGRSTTPAAAGTGWAAHSMRALAGHPGRLRWTRIRPPPPGCRRSRLGVRELGAPALAARAGETAAPSSTTIASCRRTARRPGSSPDRWRTSGSTSARLRRDRLQGAPSQPGRADGARRRDRLLCHRRAGLRRHRPGQVRDVRGSRPIWPEKKGKPEIYPWRVEAEPLLILPEDEFVPAEELATELEHVRKWPPDHWHLAFQGQLRTIGERDATLLRERLTSAMASA